MQLKRYHRLKTLLLLSFLFSCYVASAQDKAAKIDALIRQYADNRQFNGSVLVAEHGKVLFKKGYGMANMEWNVPNAPDTKFRLGSITKQFTAMLIMQLVEQGKLKLDGNVTNYLPDYPKATGGKITIHHLLTHTSGIPNYTDDPDFFQAKSRNPVTPNAFLKTFANRPLDFEPGQKFAYSNSGYFLLGAIIEHVTGKSYETVLKDQILTPLQLQDTGYDLFEPIIKKRATGYEKKGGAYVNAPYLDMSIPYAAGSLYSTVEDLYRWDQALYTDKLLSAAGRKTMFTPFLNHYAYGWGIGNVKIGQLRDSVQVIEHSGGINGFNTIIRRIPADKQLIVLLNNTGGAPLGAISTGITAILYDQPVAPVKKSIAEALRGPVLTEPVDRLRTRLTALKADKTYALNEDEMNSLGYELLRDGHPKEALNVLMLNAESFPQSGNVYDSRGEAYMTLGDKEAAIRDYKKALELDPRNANAVTKLNQLGAPVEKPVIREIAVDSATLATYVGTYQLAPTFSIRVTQEGKRLFAQATNQDRFELFAESKTKFFLKVVDAQVSFVTNEAGKIDQLILHQNGMNQPAKRID